MIPEQSDGSIAAEIIVLVEHICFDSSYQDDQEQWCSAILLISSDGIIGLF